MKVFTIKTLGGYSGGMAVIAANEKEEVLRVLASDEKTCESCELYNDQGYYVSNVKDATRIVSCLFDIESLEESTTLQTNVTDPQVLYCQYYCE